MIDPRYLAGFIDGEGCLRIAKHYSYVYPCLLITHTNKDILLAIQKQYGGDIRQSIATKKNKNWKPSWLYRLSRKKLYPLIDAIEPHCILKADQILLIRAFQTTKETYRMINIETKKLLLDQSKWLNKKGNIAYPEPMMEALCH